MASLPNPPASEGPLQGNSPFDASSCRALPAATAQLTFHEGIQGANRAEPRRAVCRRRLGALRSLRTALACTDPKARIASAGGFSGDGSGDGADGEPFGGAANAAPQAAAICGPDGRVTFAGKGGGFGLFVGEIALGSREPGLAGLAIQREIVERLEILGGQDQLSVRRGRGFLPGLVRRNCGVCGAGLVGRRREGIASGCCRLRLRRGL